MEETIAHIKKAPRLSCDEIPIKNLFLAKYGQFPQKICLSPYSNETERKVVFHVKSILDRLSDINNEHPINHRYFHPCSKKYYSARQLLTLSNGIMIYLTDCIWVTNYTNNSKKSIQPDYLPKRHFLVTDKIDIYYLIEHENFVQQLSHDLINDDTLSLVEPKLASLHMIIKYKDTCYGPGSLYLRRCMHIKKPYIKDLAISYGGQQFLQIHNKIISWLDKKDASGLVLLHGAPGSGKTHYIRYLIHCLANETDRYIIYVPSNMMNDLSNPRVITLLLNYPNSLLIIEDAEGSLSRSRTTDQSVANLLNISDGLLSDSTQMKIIATFNCPLTSLDSALLRPGRLVVQYCFPSSLNIENARCVAESIGVSKIDKINEPLSLANIYAMKDEKIEEEEEVTSSQCRKCFSFNHYEGGEEE